MWEPCDMAKETHPSMNVKGDAAVTARVGAGAPSKGPVGWWGWRAPPPPSLPPPPGAGVAFLSYPPRSHVGSRRGESTAALWPERNVPKFWNLKPWRGYQASGSPEPVSTDKLRREAFPVFMEGAGIAVAVCDI